MGQNTLLIALCLWASYTHGKNIVSSDSERCRYTSSAGVIDLNPLAHDDNTPRFKDVPDQQGQFVYSWNPCSTFNEQGCQGVEMCQLSTVNPTMDYVLGKPGMSKFVEESGILFMVYTDQSDLGEIRQTYIQLECDTSLDNELVFVEENPPLVYHLRLTSRYACPNALTTPPTPPPPATATAGPPGPPGPGPNIFNLETITILLACILVSLCVLNCMIFLGLITRKSQQTTHKATNGHTNKAFEKKSLQ